jgi:cytokinesis protein
MSLILQVGNFMNGTNYAGGAYGFRIASINRLVDTKSNNGLNLLHFLERQISQHFPEIEGFLDELAGPSEANRVNLSDMQATSKSMLAEIRQIRTSLAADFEGATDGYATKMFRFAASAEEDLTELRDGIISADQAYRDVLAYYGEGETKPQSQDFFGIFRTFTSSYKVSTQADGAEIQSFAGTPTGNAKRRPPVGNGVWQLGRHCHHSPRGHQTAI